MSFFAKPGPKPPAANQVRWEADPLEDTLPELAEAAEQGGRPKKENLDNVKVSQAADLVDVVPVARQVTTPRRRKPGPAAPVVQDSTPAVDVDQRLRSLARQVRGERKRLATCVVTIGKALTEAQTLLADYAGGTFTKWLTASCGFTRRTAYDFINAYKSFGSCEVAVQARFELTAMVMLARVSTPAAARSAALELATSGEHVTTKTVRRLIAEHSPAKPTRSKPLSVVAGGGAVVVRHKLGEDPVRILEAALAELRLTRSAAA